ncbi:uncharacterized protein LOC130997678 [Salvia miltiorrhiza]|uniref:uncharacterized protein LOC130997678 n=1 Tax=Salvia miltiorrhiza TaxID=226208 RepID=UPI0025ABDA27|nr:uncharacterized protein LOC130997678 [Salvia miltiorrhiza]
MLDRFGSGERALAALEFPALTLPALSLLCSGSAALPCCTAMPALALVCLLCSGACSSVYFSGSAALLWSSLVLAVSALESTALALSARVRFCSDSASLVLAALGLLYAGLAALLCSAAPLGAAFPQELP